MDRPQSILETLGFHGLQALERPILAALVTGDPLLTLANTLFGTMYTGMEGVFTKTWTITL